MIRTLPMLALRKSNSIHECPITLTAAPNPAVPLEWFPKQFQMEILSNVSQACRFYQN